MSSQSTSDELSSPVFHVSSLQSPDDLLRYSSPSERCHLCNQHSKAFYCRDCIRTGNFYHSQMKIPERYADKKLRLIQVRCETIHQSEECERLHNEKMRHLILSEDLDLTKERLETLRKILHEAKQGVNTTKSKCETLKNSSKARQKRLPVFCHKLLEIRQMVGQQAKKVNAKKSLLAKTMQELKHVMQQSTHELTEYVFPITEVTTAPRCESDSKDVDTATAIAEASTLAYIRGRWVYTDVMHGTRYRVVHPVLSASVNDETCQLPSSEHGVCAGLAYLTQLVNVLAFYLDVNLPFRICYSDFCKHELREQDFIKQVFRLNTNVLYLCLSQNVSANILRPTHTVQNVLSLINPETSELGRQGSFEISTALLESMESMSIGEGEDSDSEEMDFLSLGWEKLPNITAEDISKAMATAEIPSQATHAQQGLMSSVMSLWRGFST